MKLSIIIDLLNYPGINGVVFYFSKNILLILLKFNQIIGKNNKYNAFTRIFLTLYLCNIFKYVKYTDK